MIVSEAQVWLGLANEIPFVKAGQSGRCSDWEFAFDLHNLVSTIN